MRTIPRRVSAASEPVSVRTGEPRLLYLVAEDWYFISHRLPMARAALDLGWDVHVATRVAAHGDAIRREGFVLHELDWWRGTVNPLLLWRMVSHVRRLYRRLRPNIVHQVGLQTSLIGLLAGLGLELRTISAVTGLGYAFVSARLPVRVVRRPVAWALRVLVNRRRTTVLVQNEDDRAELIRLGIGQARIELVPGSGVDVDHFVPQPEPTGITTVAYVGRLLRAKGLETILDAHQINLDRGCELRLIIAGDVDPFSRDSVQRAEVERWRRMPNVELVGHVDDVRSIWRRAHICVLASVREGMPMSLLEAAASGRPIVSTNVPGSRAVARHGINALLVPADDSQAMADAIVRLAGDASLRNSLGRAGRHLAVAELSSARVGSATAALYQRVLVG